MGVTLPYGEAGVKPSAVSSPVVIKAAVQPESMWDGLTDIWNDMGTSVSGAWNMTENYVESAWDTTKLTTYGAYLTAEEKATDIVQEIKDGAKSTFSLGDDLFSWLQGKLLFFIGIGLLIIVVLAKTGIITQATDAVRAVYGG